MDGRIMMRVGGSVYINDFDGSNRQKLVSALPGDTAFFDRDYTVIYSLQPSSSAPTTNVLTSTDLRLEADK